MMRGLSNLNGYTAMSQQTETRWEFDHLSVDAAGGDPGIGALAKLLGLTPGERPPFPFPGQWLYGAGKAVLHVIETPANITPQPVINHIAFRSEARLDAVLATVATTGLPHRVLRIPDRAVAQIFVGVSPGLTIELDVPLTSEDASTAEYRHADDAPKAC
jgi:hypothetical protein